MNYPMSLSMLLVVIIAATMTMTTDAFLSPSLRTSTNTRTTSSLNNGGLEQIEFKIFPDGRIEETVRGIKGGECHSVTKEINESLGRVVDTKPTEEMYEQEIVIDQTIEIQNGQDSGWEGSSSW